MKVLIADPLAQDSISMIKKAGMNIEDCSNISKEEISHRLKSVEVMIVRSSTRIDKNMIDKMDSMKLIIRAGVGLDNIDVNYAQQRGIIIKSIPSVSAISVAELTIGHMIAIARQIVQGTVSIKEGRWEKYKLLGYELFGKTLGIIGFGHIGKEVAKRAKAFCMKIIVYHPNKKFKNIKTTSLDTLLRISDFITLHIPLNSETRYFLSNKEFDKMKKGVFIINTSRGGIIDEIALLEALKTGKVGGISLDVFEEEPPMCVELFNFPNVIFTPHLGASTLEAQKRVGQEVVKIIKESMYKL